MSTSESRDMEEGRTPVSERVTLASLRSQLTSATSTTLDEAMGTRARFRQEERLRADLRRDRRLRQQAITERIQAMKSNVAQELSLQHDMTLDALERDLRSNMEEELATLERESLATEEARMRQELDLRLHRQVEALREKNDMELNAQLHERQHTIKASIERQLREEYDRRLDIQKERIRLEHNQALQHRLRSMETTLAEEMEQQFQHMEGKEISRLEEGHEAMLSEREDQLRRGIRSRLEQQLRQRLRQREARLKVEFDRRSLRLEEDVAQQLQTEIEIKLRDETKLLEDNLRDDVEMALAKRRDELRVEIERHLNEQHASKMAERKSRLKAKYDLTFSKAIDDISRSLQTEIQAELDHRSDSEYNAYRSARESEIQNRLSRYRYEREAELRDQLESTFTLTKKDWTERLDLEFQSREAAARKAIMSELDAQLRNERLSHETDLDLLKEETTLELEINMEERLNEFKARKETEVASQLERQLDKREEIMRNKALIDVRKREGQIRAEIEAQLGLKRAEIRDRLKGLSERMDSFKEMAEDKMRDAVSKQIQDDIDVGEAELKTREEEYSALQTTDTRAEKRQKWMQSISGTSPAAFGAGAADPASLGARPDGLGAAAGRPLRGIMGQQTQSEPRMGLGGMRAPATSAKPLTTPTIAARTVRQPIAEPTVATPAKVIRQPVVTPAQVVPQEEKAVETLVEETVESTVGDLSSDAAEEPGDVIEQEMDDLLDESMLEEEIEPDGGSISEAIETVEAETQLELAPEAIQEPVSDEVETVESEQQLDHAPESMDEVAAEESVGEQGLKPSELRPIRGVLSPADGDEPDPQTASLTPVGPTLVPGKKKRGSPPSSTKGSPATAQLRPVKSTLNPVKKAPVKRLEPQDDSNE